jgi:hypothetical protein
MLGLHGAGAVTRASAANDWAVSLSDVVPFLFIQIDPECVNHI